MSKRVAKRVSRVQSKGLSGDVLSDSRKRPNDVGEIEKTVSRPIKGGKGTGKKGTGKIVTEIADRELEIMKVFTSPKWSETAYLSRYTTVNMVQENSKDETVKSTDAAEKPHSESILNAVIDDSDGIDEKSTRTIEDEKSTKTIEDDRKHNNNVSNASLASTDGVNYFGMDELGDESLSAMTDVVETNKSRKTRISSIGSDNINLVLDKEKMSIASDLKDSTSNQTKTLNTGYAVQVERILCEKPSSATKYGSAYRSRTSSKGTVINKLLTSADIVDPGHSGDTSLWSMKKSPIVTCVKGQNEAKLLAAEQLNRELATQMAQGITMRRAQRMLGPYLVEGLLEVARHYRSDPFHCLGIWLLRQAEIRDEKIMERHSPRDIDEEESVSLEQ